MNDPPNPVRQWMRAARKEFKSSDEMKAALETVQDQNSRKLLEREAQEWALEELRFKPERTQVRPTTTNVKTRRS